MRSRWYHRPTLHAPRSEHESKKVSWLELFYDLVFVAAIIQLGDFLSADTSLTGFGMFALHFVPLWLAWTGFTFYANRYTVDDFTHRTAVLVQMFMVGTMAITSHDAMQGHPTRFAIAYALAQAIISGLYLRAWKQEPSSRAYSGYWAGVFAVGSVAFLISALLPSPWCYLAWAAGIGAILFSPVNRISRELSERFPIDQEHLSERYGLLTIIVLGESFVKVLTYLTGSDHGSELDYLLKGFFNLTLTCCIWWVYFDDVAGAKLKKHRGAWVMWLYGHLPLTLAITAVGVAVKQAIKFDSAVVAPESARWLLAGSLALTLWSVAMIDSVTARENAELSDRNRLVARISGVGVVLLLGQIGGGVSSGIFLALVAAVMVAQVIFDMMMAPFEESEEMGRTELIADTVRRNKEDGGPAPRRPIADVSQAVRKGAPAELRRDLYFFFIEGSWVRLLLSFVFVYVFLNVIFAALYMLEPGAVEGGPAMGFRQAFGFSVQTLSSLGYGAITPETPWADGVVTVEAAVGMLFAALATGVIFAKASRPHSSVLFSDKLVFTTNNGQPTLMLRIANARGNEVVDASVTVSVLLEEITAEGQHIRRVRDLKLARDRQPLFALSWLLWHEIDEESPLFGLDKHNLGEHIVGTIVTMMGHDGTYGQTTYSRHMYRPEDIVVDAHFVDVISQLEDGRLMIDLSRFHMTEPDAA